MADGLFSMDNIDWTQEDENPNIHQYVDPSQTSGTYFDPSSPEGLKSAQDHEYFSNLFHDQAPGGWIDKHLDGIIKAGGIITTGLAGGAAIGNLMGAGGYGAGAALDSGSLTASDMALSPGAAGAIGSTAGATAEDIALMQGVGGTGAGLTSAINGGGLSSTAGGGGLGSLFSPSNLSTISSLAKLGEGIYDKYAANQKAGVLQSNADTLNNMYQPGTPEYELWKQSLDRRDAASGRRSQYGPRSVELAAAMAKQRSANLTSPGYSNLLGGALDNRYGSLQSLFNNASGIAGAVKGAPQLYNSISNLFSGAGTANKAGTTGDAISNIGADDALSYLF